MSIHVFISCFLFVALGFFIPGAVEEVLAQQQASKCPCCCPEMAVTPEFHRMQDQILGQQLANFSASALTGQRQRVFASSGIVTVMSEISVVGANKAAYPAPQVVGDSASTTAPGAAAAAAAAAQTEDAASGGSQKNCSWNDRTGERCSVFSCLSHWQQNEVQWHFESLQGHISDILSSGLRTISPTVTVQVDAAFDGFQQRMSQSSKVALGAVYQLDSPATCHGAVTGLPCYESKEKAVTSETSKKPFSYWYLGHSGLASLSVLAIPIGGTAQAVVEQILPSCTKILDQLRKGAVSASSSSSSSSSSVAGHNLSATKNLTAGLKLTGSKIESWVLAATPQFDYITALSRPDRVLCVHDVDESSVSTESEASSSSAAASSSSEASVSQYYSNSGVIAVVPIVRSSRDVIFTKDVEVRACVRTHFHNSQPGVCGMRFVQGDAKCGAQRVLVQREYSVMLTLCAYMGLAVAVVSSLALLFGASAIMIAIDAQLLAVIAQGSCSSSVSRPATLYLQQFLFLGRAVEQENTTVSFYSGIIAWLVGCVCVALAVHGLLVLIVSLIWRTLLKRAKSKAVYDAKTQQSQSGSTNTSPAREGAKSAATAAAAGSGAGGGGGGDGEKTSSGSKKSGKFEKVQIGLFEKILVALNVNSAAAGSSPNSSALARGNENTNNNDNRYDSSSSSAANKNKTSAAVGANSVVANTVIAASNKSGEIKNSAIAQGFALEERRILARTAAALRFPSASLRVLLVALQGLWFAAVNVWWYSKTPVESMPGIVGCLFALLMTLIILVLARQTKLTFTPYSWLHPEQAAADARAEAMEVSARMERRSMRYFSRSFLYPFGQWGPSRPRQRMGTLFLPVKSRGALSVPFLVSLITCLTVSIYPITILGCCAQQMFLAMFFFAVALVFWKSKPMRAPYANTMFVAVRGALSFLCFARTVVLVTEDAFFDTAHFILMFLVQALILVVGFIDIWCGLAEDAVWLPHLEYRQSVIRARTGGALRQQRLREEEAALEGDDEDEDEYSDNSGGGSSRSPDRQQQQQQQPQRRYQQGGSYDPSSSSSAPLLASFFGSDTLDYSEMQADLLAEELDPHGGIRMEDL